MKTYLLTGLGSLLILVLAIAGGSAENPAPGPIDLERGGRAHWKEKRFNASPTRYLTLEENGRKTLLAQSRDSVSALWLPVETPVAESLKLSWRWRVTRGLSNNSKERQKAGDDYAARVFVSFDRDPFDKSSRALCYAWASEEPVDSVYPSPYSENVVMIVVQSGGEKTGKWIVETRDIARDFRRVFGEEPGTLWALAVMVDTDNTASRATAWFSDFTLGDVSRPTDVIPSEI
jgi:hypothetical protein